MDIEEIQEKIELTEEQQKAWKKFERAVKECKKSGIYFYQVLATMGALNGKDVDGIIWTECDVYYDSLLHTGDNSLQYLSYPEIMITDGAADDTHWVKLKGEKVI